MIYIDQPDEIILDLDSLSHVNDQSLGQIFVSTNSDEGFSYSWIGPDGFFPIREILIR